MNSVLPLLPEAYLLLTALGLVLAESAHHEEKVRLVLPTSLLGIAGALLQTLLAYQGQPAQILAGTLSFDGFSLFFKTLFLLLAAVGVSSACLVTRFRRRVGPNSAPSSFSAPSGSRSPPARPTFLWRSLRSSWPASAGIFLRAFTARARLPLNPR